MIPPVSVIIPTRNAAAHLPACLAALAPGAALIRDIIVVDAASTDGTAALAPGRLINAPPGRGGQLRAGCEAATGDFLLLLHADTVLAPDWPAAAQIAIKNPESAHYFRLRLNSTHPAARIIEAGAALRCRCFALPYGDQALLISRTLLAAIGGVPDMPLMEDVALARRLGGRLSPLPATATTSAEKYERDGWIARPARNLACLALFFAGLSPAKIKSVYG
jgi:rSAM/selenodomain-associated transferase 2